MLAILDYGIGNVRSVLNAFEYLGTDAELTRDPDVISRAGGLVIPGVGAFGEGMGRIESYGLTRIIKEAVNIGKPTLGICLGFQLLMRSSTELGEHKGLSLFPLEVKRLPTSARLPHMGWASVRSDTSPDGTSRLLNGLEGADFYFVHTYGVSHVSTPYVTASTEYGGERFLAYIEHQSLFGVQFHPEKSSEAGLHLLKNFAGLVS